MPKRKRKKRRGAAIRRGHHGEEKLHGFASWRRHVVGSDGTVHSIAIQTPGDLESMRFMWSVTSGFMTDEELKEWLDKPS